MALALAVASPAFADTIASPAPDKVAVTLYRGGEGPFQTLEAWERQEAMEKGLILVTETRTVILPAGRHTLRFDGVADALIPQSAAIEGLPGGVIERNYDYALLSPGTLVERSLDQPVRIVRTNRKTGRQSQETAILRQGPEGVVVQTAGGVEALGCSGGIERLVFDRAPDGLSDKPALSTVVDIPAPTTATLTLSYLAIGVNWQADYVARIHPDGRTLDLTGWLTLVNASGTSFANAPTQAVAGKLAREAVDVQRGQGAEIERECWPLGTTHVGRAAPPPPPPPMMAMMAPAPAMMAERTDVQEIMVTAKRKMAEQSDLGDYKLYTLPEPVTLAARQTKQVAFLDQKAVAFQRLYVSSVDPGEDYDDGDAQGYEAAKVVLRLDNKLGEGLGKPLPSGALAVMETADGRPAFAGEQALRDVPVGQPFDLAIGEAMDVQIRPRLVSEVALGKSRLRRAYEVDLSSAKTAPIVVELRMPTNRREGFKIVAEPGQHDVRDGDLAWRFNLAPGSRKTVQYVVEYDD